MLDILAEALIELLGGKKNAPPARTRRSGPTARDGVPAPSSADPFRKDPEPEPPPPQQRTMTLEDLVRKISGMDEVEEDTVDEDEFMPSYPPVYEQPVQSRAADQKLAEEQLTRRRALAEQMRRDRELAEAGAKRAALAASSDIAQRSAASTDSNGLDFVSRIKANPAAAREAFVFSEIFGRPLGDRQ